MQSWKPVAEPVTFNMLTTGEEAMSQLLLSATVGE